jgi:hypothetical protein
LFWINILIFIVILSNDCLRWKLLNPPTEENIQKLETCKGRFTGDPTHEFECKKYKVVGEGDEEHIEEEIVRKILYNHFSKNYNQIYFCSHYSFS